MRLQRIISWTLPLVLLALGMVAVEACPACKDNINTGDESLQMAYSGTVLGMIAIPFAIIGGFAFWVFKSGALDAPEVPDQQPIQRRLK